MKDRKSRLRSQRGQSLVEVALLTPLLLSLMVGTIEMGRYAYLSILVGNAARAGAAYGSQSLALSVDGTGILTAATNDFQNNGPSGGVLAVSGGFLERLLRFVRMRQRRNDHGRDVQPQCQSQCGYLRHRTLGSDGFGEGFGQV